MLSESYELADVSGDEIEGCGEIKEQIDKVRNENYQQYCQAVPQAKTPTDSELEELANKKAKTTEERLIERKGNLNKRYGIKVTPELVQKDDDGWYHQLQLQYSLTIGNQYLVERDRRSLAQLKKQGNGKAFKVDINRKQLSMQIKALKDLKIEQFFNPDSEFTKDSLHDWFEMILPARFQIQMVLGVSINPEKDSAIAVAQRLLKKLGQKLEFKHQIRIDGKPTRVYQGCKLDPDERLAVFDNWLERDMSQPSVTPFSKEDIYMGGVTTA